MRASSYALPPGQLQKGGAPPPQSVDFFSESLAFSLEWCARFLW